MDYIKLIQPLPNSSEDKVTIEVNVASEQSSSLVLISIVGELLHYPYAKPATSTFNLEIRAPTKANFITEEDESLVEDENAPTLYIHSIDKFGVVDVRFS